MSAASIKQRADESLIAMRDDLGQPDRNDPKSKPDACRVRFILMEVSADEGENSSLQLWLQL